VDDLLQLVKKIVSKALEMKKQHAFLSNSNKSSLNCFKIWFISLFYFSITNCWHHSCAPASPPAQPLLLSLSVPAALECPVEDGM
jgi:hypothetical protein